VVEEEGENQRVSEIHAEGDVRSDPHCLPPWTALRHPVLEGIATYGIRRRQNAHDRTGLPRVESTRTNPVIEKNTSLPNCNNIMKPAATWFDGTWVNASEWTEMTAVNVSRRTMSISHAPFHDSLSA